MATTSELDQAPLHTSNSGTDDVTTAATPPSAETPRKTLVNGVNVSSWSYRLKLALALAFPVFLETLDYTVVASVQPRVASAFNALPEQSWIGTAYILTSTVFLPVFGSLSDIFGRHWSLQVSLIFFLVGNAFCTGAQNLPMLLAGRGIAGVGCAGLIAVVRVILSDSTSLDNNNFQSAMLILLYSVGFSVGPVIGGALASVDWRWIFAINLPCGVASSVLVFLLVRKTLKPAQINRRHLASLPQTESEATASTANFAVPAAPKETLSEKLLRVDWIGSGLFIAGGILILLGLNWGSTFSWSEGRVIAVLVVGGLLIVAFVLWSWLLETYDHALSPAYPNSNKNVPKAFKTTEAMIPIDIYRNYDVCATNFAALTGGMVMFGCFYFVSIYFILVAGYSPTKSGAQLLFFAPGLGVGTMIAIQMIKYTRQPKYPIILGMVIQPIALGLLGLGIVKDNYAWIDGFLAMAGTGVGMTFGPLSLHARFSQPEERVAVVVSLNLFFRSAGGTMGLAQLGAVLNAKVRGSITSLLASGTLSQDQATALSHASINSLGSIADLPPDLVNVVRGAFREGTKWSFYSLLPWCALAAVLCFPLSKIKDTDVIAGKKKDDEKKAVENKNGDAEKVGEVATNENADAGSSSAPPTGRPAPVVMEEVKKPQFVGPISYIFLYIRYRIRKARAEKRFKEAKAAEAAQTQPRV